jgi:hypothetical protein
MNMRRSTPESGFSPLVVPFGLSVLFLVGALIFGGWAYMQMLDYKNHSDTKVAAAVAQAKLDEDKVKDAAFAEAEKQPLTMYQGPGAYGSVDVSYPKTWSAYVIDTRNSTPYIDGYFHPGSVPDSNGQGSVFSLRVQVVQDAYSDVLAGFSSSVKSGKVTVSPYAAPKVTNVIGVRIDGQLTPTKSGSMIVLPLRNMTLKVWTEAPQFENDFNNNVLPNLTFRP